MQRPAARRGLTISAVDADLLALVWGRTLRKLDSPHAIDQPSLERHACPGFPEGPP